MKNSFILIALLFVSFNTFASSINTVKVFDGTFAYCNNKTDKYRNKTGAYRLQGKAVSIENGKLKINTNIGFLECLEMDNGTFAFRNVGPNHTYKYLIINGKSEKETITVKTKKVILKTYVTRKYRSRGSKLEVTDTPVSNDSTRGGLNIEMGVESVLSDAQVLTIQTGGKVKTAVEAYISKDVTFERENGEVWDDKISFGSFRFFIEVSEDEKGMLKARFVK